MTKESYHYDSVIFEVYAAQMPQVDLQPTHPTSFYTHHHLKVLPEDAICASVQQTNDENRLMALFLPCKLWIEVIEPKQIKSIILARNKRHFQQASIKDSRVPDPLMQHLLENNGTNNLVDQYL